MASYYYLMSSLPMLKSDGDMPIEYSKFLSYCEDTVSADKYKLLAELSIDSVKGPLVIEWAKFYRIYKTELNYQRNKRLERPCEIPYGRDDEIAKVITLAMADKNPLNAEKTLLALQFDKLDSLIGTHAFDDYALFGYALKLKLLERKASFVQKRGKKELDRLVKRLEEQIESIN